MRLIEIITGAVRTIIRRNKMSNKNVPSMAGLNHNGQLTFNGQRVTHKKNNSNSGRMANPYTICNIGKRIWNPILQEHVDYQEFYRLIREENIDLSELKINSHVLVGSTNGKYKFEGTLSEAEFLHNHGIIQPGVTSVTTADDIKIQSVDTETDSLAQVCVNQAVALDKKQSMIEALEGELKHANKGLRDLRDIATAIKFKAKDFEDASNYYSSDSSNDEMEIPF